MFLVTKLQDCGLVCSGDVLPSALKISCFFFSVRFHAVSLNIQKTNELHGQSPSLETNSHSPSQGILLLLREHEASLSYSQEPTIGPYPEPGASSPHLLKLFFQDPC